MQEGVEVKVCKGYGPTIIHHFSKKVALNTGSSGPLLIKTCNLSEHL